MKALSYILILVMFLSAFTSCAAEETESSETTQTESVMTASESTGIQRPVLPEKDYDGYQFIILNNVRSVTLNYFDVESENGDILNDSIYARNRTVEEQFNVKIESIPDGVNAGKIRSSISAGEDAYDLLVGFMSEMGTLAFEKLLHDLNEIPHLNLDKPWWDTGINNDITIVNRLFFGSGSLIVTNYDATFIVRFNIDLGKDHGIDKQDLYNLVRDGNWTIDQMISLGKTFTSDLNGDGDFTWEDRYGIACTDSFVQALFYGAGLSVTEKDEEDLVKFNDFSDRTDGALKKIMEIYTTKGYALNGNQTKEPGLNHAQTADKAIVDGRAFFQATLIEAMIRSRGAETAIGILPIPKYEESQQSYTSMINPNGVAVLLGVAITAQDIERTGIITEALMSESYFGVRDAYFNAVLQHKLLRDEESFEMLDYILANRVAPDIGYIYSYGNLLQSIVTACTTGNGNFASIYQAAKKPAMTKIEEHISIMSGLK